MSKKFILAVLALSTGLILMACEELPVTPDTDPPTVAITSPGAGTTATDSIVITVDATDNEAVAKVEIFFTSRTMPVGRDTVAPYEFTIPLADVTSGVQQFFAVATDEADNQSFTAPVSFTAQRTPGLRFLSQFAVSGTAVDVAASGNIAVIAAGDGGLFAIDMTNVFIPEFAGRFRNSNFIGGVIINGQTVFAASGDSYVTILTTATPDTLIATATVRVQGIFANQLSLLNNTLSVAGGIGGMLQMDASQQDTLIELGRYDQGGEVKDVERIGNYVFSADGDEGMRVIDVSVPDSLIAVYRFVPSNQAQDLYLAGTHAYLADGGRGVHSFNISDPANPIYLFTYDAGQLVSGIKGEGRWLYAAVGDLGVDVIDANDPNLMVPPSVPGNFNTVGYAHRLAVHQGYVLVADNTHFTILKWVAP
jgi:hypothetical protein